MKKTLFTLAIALIAGLITYSCRDWEDYLPPDGSDDPPGKPVLTRTDGSEIPDNGLNIYYMIDMDWYIGDCMNQPQVNILNTLIKNGFKIRNAWYPASPVLCKAMNAIEAMVIELEYPNDRILEYGCIEEPGRWLINCGVKSFYHYAY